MYAMYADHRFVVIDAKNTRAAATIVKIVSIQMSYFLMHRLSNRPATNAPMAPRSVIAASAAPLYKSVSFASISFHNNWMYDWTLIGGDEGEKKIHFYRFESI